MLEFEAQWTTYLIKETQHSKLFINWLKDSQYVDDFEIEYDTDHEGQPIIQITQCNPFFSLDALEHVYNTQNNVTMDKIMKDLNTNLQKELKRFE